MNENKKFFPKDGTTNKPIVFRYDVGFIHSTQFWKFIFFPENLKICFNCPVISRISLNLRKKIPKFKKKFAKIMEINEMEINVQTNEKTTFDLSFI